MLSLNEDKDEISQIIYQYLKEKSVSLWKFETLMIKLLSQGLLIQPTDNDLLEIGDLYKKEIEKFTNNYSNRLVKRDHKKIGDLLNSVSLVCVAKQIKLLVRETNFLSNYALDLKNHFLGSSEQQQQQQQQQQQRQPFWSFNPQEKMTYLVEKFGTEGCLDLMKDKLSKRFNLTIKDLRKKLWLNLKLKVTLEERDMLIKISKCNNACDVEALLQEFFTSSLSPSGKFIRSALVSAQLLWDSKQLLKTCHNEDWFRLHVYSNVFDKAFMNDEEFDMKRSECYSNITKLFPNEPDQRVDFILRNLNNDSDLFSTEEKPGRKGVKGDLEKGKALQRLMLRRWFKEIGSIQLLNKLEAITCQWEGTKLIIFGSRTISAKHTITYKKGVFYMPKTYNHLEEFSKLLLAVLSLRRLVFSNYTKINMIMKEKQREEVALLDVEDDDDLNLRSDSTYESDDLDSENNEDWKMDGDLEAELLTVIDQIDDGNEDGLLSCSDWEEFLLEAAKKKRKFGD